LKQGATSYTALGSAGAYTVSVPNGILEIWINNVDTTKTFTINDAAASQTVDYYP
jgi:hypothetical protein